MNVKPFGLHSASRYKGIAAAEIEPAVVFPPQHLAVVPELKCHPGAVSIPTHLLIQTWEHLCDEISRNAETMSDTALGFALDSMTLPMLWQLYARVAIESKADMDALVPIELQITRRLQEEWGVCLAHVINAKRLYGYP